MVLMGPADIGACCDGVFIVTGTGSSKESSEKESST